MIPIIKAVYEEQSLYNVQEKKAYTDASEIAFAFKHLEVETKEHFICLHLTAKNKPLYIDIVSVGSLTQALVHPREVFKMALLSNAHSVIFIHNHPSGSYTPSIEDIKLTSRLEECAQLLGIRVLDHVIIAAKGYFSFADKGLLR
jgi:DNA repair protein RadC